MKEPEVTQRVLVTAGASGIGLVVAQTFAADGALVHVADIDPDAVAAADKLHSNISASVVDVADPGAVDVLFERIRSVLGGLDVLVNNAGIAGPTAPIESYDPTAWAAVLAVNLTGTFLITQRAIALLKQSDRASVITMSSLAGRFGYPNRVAYATTKWGVIGFAKSLALELGEHGITSNTINPGAVDGPRFMAMLDGRAKGSGRSVAEEMSVALANQSIKRLVDPADIAALILFLAGPHGRSISGQVFPIDGDSKAAQ